MRPSEPSAATRLTATEEFAITEYLSLFPCIVFLRYFTLSRLYACVCVCVTLIVKEEAKEKTKGKKHAEKYREFQNNNKKKATATIKKPAKKLMICIGYQKFFANVFISLSSY